MKRIIAYKDYYKSFMETLVKEEQLKIRRALLLLQTDDKVPRHFIKYLDEKAKTLKAQYYAEK